MKSVVGLSSSRVRIWIAVVCLILIPSWAAAQFSGTARDWYDAAENQAHTWHSDADLLYMLGGGEDIHLAGEALIWSYIFDSDSDDSLYMVVMSLGFPVYADEIFDTLTIVDPLPSNWIDSDAAIAVAEDNGGSDFRQNTGSDLIVASAGRSLYVPEFTRPVWMFMYTDTTQFGETILIYVDAVTGAYIDTQGLGIGDGNGGGQALPKALELSQNYPNPFNPSTTLKYSIPEGKARPVSLEVYDVRGRRVKTLFDGERAPGNYVCHWDGKDDRGARLGAGIYLARLRSGGDLLVRKMSLVK